jgi:hypothetical protein
MLRGLALLFLAALPARAQEEPPPEPARFLIEEITVEGPKKAAANIVRAETLLREGESYTEDQLREAVYRVHRLPFVLDASFALRKGSQRGAYELVVEVEPARWFFYDHWIRAYRFGEPLDLESPDFRFERERSSLSLGGIVGARLFVGRSGVLFAALDPEEGLHAGFTKYDLFGRGILVSAGTDFCCKLEVMPLGLDPTFSSLTYERSGKASLNVAVPLGRRQSIQVAVSERRSGTVRRDEVLISREPQPAFFFEQGVPNFRRAEAKWVLDTSDDPLLPTRGVSISAGLEASRLEVRQRMGISSAGNFTPVPLPRLRSRLVAAALSGIRHWSLTPRQTVSVTGRVSAGRSRVESLIAGDRVLPATDLDSYGASVGLQHAVTLKRSRGAGNFTDLRLESGIELGAEKVTPGFAPNPLERLQVSAGLVFRNQWGRVRLSLSYLDVGKVFG